MKRAERIRGVGRQPLKRKAIRSLAGEDRVEFTHFLVASRHQKRPTTAVADRLPAQLFNFGDEARIEVAARAGEFEVSVRRDRLALRSQHASGGGTGFSPRLASVHNGDLHLRLRQPQADRAADNPAANNDHVRRLGGAHRFGHRL